MSLYRRSRGRGYRALFWATLLVVLVFAIDGLFGGGIRSLARSVAGGMWNAGTSMSASVSGSGLFSTRRALESENQALREELAQLRVRAAAFDVVKEENEELREMVQLVEGAGGITAPVVSSFRSSPYGTFMIGAGSEDGVRPGDIVVAGDSLVGGFAVGRIEDVDARRALVVGIFAPGEELDALIRDVGVTLRGRGGGQAHAEAPRDAVIEAGDIVIASSFGGRSVGIVGEIEKDASDAFQHVFAHLPFPLSSLRFVYVVPN